MEQTSARESLATNDMARAVLDKPIILIDGGLGTSLEDLYDVEFSGTTPLWSSDLLISEPETLLAAQTAFSRSGADIILTATYQASYEGFANTGTGHSRTAAAEFMRSAVRIARFAIGSRPGLVALSLGAYGATMMPSQEYSGAYGEMISTEKLYDWHLDRLMLFREVWMEIDLIAFETLPRLSEIQAVRKVMQRVPAIKPYWISCVFPDNDTLPDGTTIKEVVSAMLQGDRPPFAIGINCTKVHKLPGLIESFSAAVADLSLTSLPRLVIYPDGAGGQTYDTSTQKWVGQADSEPAWDEQVAHIVMEIQAQGRWKGIVVGGCCKTTPKHIAQLKKRLDSI